MEFQGFAPETFDFLWGIRLNNNRDWFLAHKGEYQKYLYEPMKALGKDLYEPFNGMPDMLCKVSRIYRDMRMPQPNGPYKENLWISIRMDSFYWGDHPCLYFEIRPEGAGFGFVHWNPGTEMLNRFRRDLAARPDYFRTIVEKAERDTGMPFTADEYKKKKDVVPPAPERFYNCRKFFFERKIEPGPELFTPELAERVRTDLKALLPVYSYFLDLETKAE